jgi:GNAT superfamily N-acetyltransferase
MTFVPVDEDLRASPAFDALRRGWPEIVFHDAISNEYWSRIYSERPEFQFALVEDGELLAEGNSIPVSGLPASWRGAFPNAFGGDTPDRLCALAILVDPDHQGKGLSRLMLEHMRALAHERGWELVAPVRPSLKHRYPLTPIERYAEWRRADGLSSIPGCAATSGSGPRCSGSRRTRWSRKAPSRSWRNGPASSFPRVAAMSCPERSCRSRSTGSAIAGAIASRTSGCATRLPENRTAPPPVVLLGTPRERGET